ncbi:hypothetical protein MP228_006797 [Amoeboaphelidium protococcarum]|nr:hypothetical protein MP228_006797 [Amoeboaphelidium protococcarum]
MINLNWCARLMLVVAILLIDVAGSSDVALRTSYPQQMIKWLGKPSNFARSERLYNAQLRKELHQFAYSKDYVHFAQQLVEEHENGKRKSSDGLKRCLVSVEEYLQVKRSSFEMDRLDLPEIFICLLRASLINPNFRVGIEKQVYLSTQKALTDRDPSIFQNPHLSKYSDMDLQLFYKAFSRQNPILDQVDSIFVEALQFLRVNLAQIVSHDSEHLESGQKTRAFFINTDTTHFSLLAIDTKRKIALLSDSVFVLDYLPHIPLVMQSLFQNGYELFVMTARRQHDGHNCLMFAFQDLADVLQCGGLAAVQNYFSGQDSQWFGSRRNRPMFSYKTLNIGQVLTATQSRKDLEAYSKFLRVHMQEVQPESLPLLGKLNGIRNYIAVRRDKKLNKHLYTFKGQDPLLEAQKSYFINEFNAKMSLLRMQLYVLIAFDRSLL